MRTIRTPGRRRKFLQSLRECGCVSEAAQVSGIGRNAVYEWRRNDRWFAEEWEAALKEAADTLEDEARRRAMESSDRLLMFLLKGLRPEKYRENAKLTVNIEKEIDYRAMSADELRRALEGLRAAQDAAPPTLAVAS